MKTFLLFIAILQTQSANALSLLQEAQDITCASVDTRIWIDKRDRFFSINEMSYNTVEFLDTAILGSANTKSALLQMTPQDSAIIIEGELFNLRENQCSQTGDSKSCNLVSMVLTWSPVKINVSGLELQVKHYGVYPNDGTYFIAYDENGKGIAIVDFGEKFTLIVGRQIALPCEYSQ